MNWYIGQDIVAVRDHSAGHFKRGDEFKIMALKNCSCNCNQICIDIGRTHNLTSAHGQFYCKWCKATYPIVDKIQWYLEECFQPLDPIKDAISQLMEETLTIKQI